MKNLLRKISLFFVSFLVLISSYLTTFAPSAHAQTWYNQSPFEWYNKVYDDSTSPTNEIFGERYTAAQVQWVIYSVMFAPVNVFFSFLGTAPTPAICLSSFMTGSKDVEGCLSEIPTFLEALADKFKLVNMPVSPAIAQENDKLYIWKNIFLSDRPLSGLSYIRDIGRKLTLVPEAKAQASYGFSRLAPIQPLWKLTRNIAYFFFVIAILITAFMIMFKVKISPQAIITIQSALPKIVIALVLVTFSYAIAGFMVDLVYVIMGLFSQFFTPIVANQGSVTATYKFLNGWLGDGGLSIIVYAVLYWVCSVIISIVVAIVSIGTLNMSSITFGTILAIFFLINAIILIVYIFLGVFNLFKALAGFYIAVIFGPIQLAMGALPSSHGSFGKWLKSIIGKLLVFPAQGILWYFGFLFLFGALSASIQCFNLSWNYQGTINSMMNGFGKIMTNSGAPPELISQFVSYAPPGHCWGPPLLGNSGGATAIAFLLISASCILLLGKVSKMIESALAGERFDMESAISQPIKTATYSTGTLVESAGKSGRIFGIPIPGAGWVEGAGKIIQSVSR